MVYNIRAFLVLTIVICSINGNTFNNCSSIHNSISDITLQSVCEGNENGEEMVPMKKCLHTKTETDSKGAKIELVLPVSVGKSLNLNRQVKLNEVISNNKVETQRPTKQEMASAANKNMAKILSNIRLVNAEKLHGEGRVEYNVDNKWHSVCADSWDQVDANVACKELGFMSASQALKSHSYGESDTLDYTMGDIECSEGKETLGSCTFKKDAKCNMKSAGLKCLKYNSCPPGWVNFGISCYKPSEAKKTFLTAIDDCRSQGGNLFEPNSKLEFSFVANYLKPNGNDNEYWVAANYHEGQWVYGVTGASMNINEFWFDSPPADTSRVCAAMTRFQSVENAKWTATNDFWLDAFGCATSLNYVCEKLVDTGPSQRAADCYLGNGSGYTGTFKYTVMGAECVSWDSLAVKFPGVSGPGYCRNPDNDSKPWCFINAQYRIYSYCDMLQCPKATTANPNAGTLTTDPSNLLTDPFPADCGTRAVDQWDDASRIVGGFKALAGAFPWQVKFYQIGGTTRCGGSIINDRWILTAAHCFYELNSESTVLVKVGDRNDETTGAEEQSFRIIRKILHPNYTSTNSNNDLCLIKVAPKSNGEYIKFGIVVRPICLPKGDEIPKENCLISGWGTTSEGGQLSPDLKAAKVPIIPFDVCKFYMSLTNSMMCAGYLAGGTDTCQGDSGGPLACPDGSKFVLYGVTSFGNGCARANNPGVYAKTGTQIEWIKTTILNN